jgi:hypothetical protein
MQRHWLDKARALRGPGSCGVGGVISESRPREASEGAIVGVRMDNRAVTPDGAEVLVSSCETLRIVGVATWFTVSTRTVRNYLSSRSSRRS